MSSPAENTAYETPERPDRPQTVVNLGTANRMLALVRPVVRDVLQYQQQLADLREEQDSLDRRRLKLDWSGRSRRYQVHEAVAAAERHLQDALAELEVLGVAMLDAAEGRVGLPTIVNDRPAYFSWRPGEEALRFWHFVGETTRRTIPSSWAQQAEIRLLGKR